MYTHPRHRLGTIKTWLNCQYWQEKTHNICIPLRQSNAVYTIVLSQQNARAFMFINVLVLVSNLRYCHEQRQNNLFYLILQSNGQTRNRMELTNSSDYRTKPLIEFI